MILLLMNISFCDGYDIKDGKIKFDSDLQFYVAFVYLVLDSDSVSSVKHYRKNIVDAVGSKGPPSIMPYVQ
jgi:hypothetical protein